MLPYKRFQWRGLDTGFIKEEHRDHIQALSIGVQALASHFDVDKYKRLLLLQLLLFEDYNDCIKSIVWKSGKAFGVRGSTEMSELTFNKVIINILNGLFNVVLNPSDAEK